MPPPVTVLIAAADTAGLEATLTGLALARNHTPHRVVVFGVNPSPTLTLAGRCDFSFHSAEVSYPRTTLSCLAGAAATAGTDRCVWVDPGTLVGDYWLDHLLDADHPVVFSRRVFPPLPLGHASESDPFWRLSARQAFWDENNSWLLARKPVVSDLPHYQNENLGPLLLPAEVWGRLPDAVLPEHAVTPFLRRVIAEYCRKELSPPRVANLSVFCKEEERL